MHDLMHPDGYLAPRPLVPSLAWHGVANGDSQQELEFLFGDKDLHTARLASREVEKPAGRAAPWHSYFSDFGIFSPPSFLPSHCSRRQRILWHFKRLQLPLFLFVVC